MSSTQILSNHRPVETLTGKWQLDPERSSVEFRVRNLWGLMSVKGHFEDFQGRLDLDADPAIELKVDAASVHTGNSRRDEHLRSADFFDVEHHPRIRFASTSVVLRDDIAKVRGRLFARDRSIPLEFDAHVRRSDKALEIVAATEAPHRDLGMTWSPLRMISSRSRLLVKGYLVPAARPLG
jgi:polyisoprenoid-binding protein YceI